MNTFSLHFFLKKQKTRKDGTAPLYARITVNRKRAELSLKRYLLPAEWDEKKEALKGRKTSVKELNIYLESIRTKLYRHHRELIDQGEVLSAQALKDAFLGKSAKHQYTVLSVYAFHNQQMAERVGQDYSPSTLARFSTGYKHLQEFVQYHFKKEDIPLYRLDHAFIASFDHYLRTVRKINNNSTVKYVSLFRKTIRLAIRNGWLEKDPFVNYEGKLKVVDREYLDKEEIQLNDSPLLSTHKNCSYDKTKPFPLLKLPFKQGNSRLN